MNIIKREKERKEIEAQKKREKEIAAHKKREKEECKQREDEIKSGEVHVNGLEMNRGYSATAAERRSIRQHQDSDSSVFSEINRRKYAELKES